MRALIVVDIQNDFLPGGALAVASGDEVVEVANRMMRLKGSFFDLVVATQDWHPSLHKSFASQYPGRRPGETIQLNGFAQVLWPDHCVQGTLGAEFPSSLEVNRFDKIIHKGIDIEIDSYSGFFDNARLRSTELLPYLKQNGVQEVYILGLATDYCIKFTALDAASLGFQVYLIEDGCRGVNVRPQDAVESIQAMASEGIRIIKSQNIK